MTQRERQEHAKKTIFQAALAEFGAQPYETVTMDRICSRHGISKGMMYHYFSSKDELFLLCVKELFQSLQVYIQEESTQIQKENSHAAIRQYFMLRERFFAREPAWEVIFESAMVHMPEHLRADILELRPQRCSLYAGGCRRSSGHAASGHIEKVRSVFLQKNGYSAIFHFTMIA